MGRPNDDDPFSFLFCLPLPFLQPVGIARRRLLPIAMDCRRRLPIKFSNFCSVLGLKGVGLVAKIARAIKEENRKKSSAGMLINFF